MPQLRIVLPSVTKASIRCLATEVSKGAKGYLPRGGLCSAVQRNVCSERCVELGLIATEVQYPLTRACSTSAALVAAGKHTNVRTHRTSSDPAYLSVYLYIREGRRMLLFPYIYICNNKSTDRRVLYPLPYFKNPIFKSFFLFL